MKATHWRSLSLGLALLAVAGCEPEADLDTSRPAAVAAGRELPDPLLEEGRQAYVTYCAGCHGDAGDGKGPAAAFLHPRPRNFQDAKFKFTSTRAGRLPTDDDLRRSIVEGLKGSAMPSWRLLPDHTVTALIAYIKTFSTKWVERRPAPQIPVVNDPYRSAENKEEAIARGEVVYHGFATCWTCHPSYVPESKVNQYLVQMGNPSRDAFRSGLFESEVKPNEDGELIYPPDFHRDFVRSGMDVEDLYRSIAAGITGTAMPTWVDSMEYESPHGGPLVQTEDLWAIAYYVQDLIRHRPALLPADGFAHRRRPVPIYLHGEPPKPVEEAAPATDEEFTED